MAKISDLSGDEREQRVAELKKKMQEAAAKRAEEQAAEAEESVSEAKTAPAAVAEAEPPAAATETASAGEAPAVAVESEEMVDTAAAPPAAQVEAVADPSEIDVAGSDIDETEVIVTETEPAAETAAVAPTTNGTNGAGMSSPESIIYEKSEEEQLQAEMNRREFLTYAWGAALGLLTVQGLGVSFFFMYPRFREGEFGGVFRMGPEGSVPPTDAAPVPVADGKFWWVNVGDEGPQAIYMVCTHLGCLYKWVGERDRFECPCHGSKFTREGYYIEGPAARSLDYFVTTLVDGEWLVDTGAKVLGGPAAESPARGDV